MEKEPIKIAFSSDWHLGNTYSHNRYPTPDEINASFQHALSEGVDAYVIAGDFVDKGQLLFARYAASIIRPYIEKGLLVIGIVGNHDFSNGTKDGVVSILAESGVVMLEGGSHIVTNKTHDRALTILGVSGETGPEYDSWWRTDGWSEEGREKAHAAGEIHRRALDKGLKKSVTDTVVVVTHRSIVPDTIGTKAREKEFVSAQTEGFAEIIDRYSTKNIVSFVGHDHDVFPWEGFPKGRTKGGAATYNIAAPLRLRMGKPLEKIMTF